MKTDTNHRLTRIKSISLHLGLVLLSSFTILLCLELGCRLIKQDSMFLWQGKGGFQPDPELIYSMQPNYSGEVQHELWKEKRVFNSIGLRNREITEKTPGTKRMIILGDSFTYGHGVSSEESYPFQLERLFHKNHQPVEVINAGIPGYGTDQEYKFFLTRLYPLKPDYLIVSFSNNDIGDNIDHPLYTFDSSDRLKPLDAKQVWIYELGNIYLSAPGWFRHSALFRFLLSRFASQDIHHLRPAISREQLHQWSLKKIIRELKELKQSETLYGYRLIVIRMPDINCVKKTGKGYDSYPEASFSVLKQSLQDIKIPYYDAIPDFTVLQQTENQFLRDEYHLNPKGNSNLAEFVYKIITNSE